MSKERFAKLYENYCDGVLGTDELAEFKAMLHEPDLAREFVVLANFEALMYEELRLAREQSNTTVTKDGIQHAPELSAVVKEPVNRTSPHIFRSYRLYAGLGIAADIAIIAMVGYKNYFLTQPPEHPTVAKLKEMAVPEMAVVTNATDAILRRGSDSLPASNGIALQSGDVLKSIADRKIRLDYPDGTSIELDGETELMLELRDGAKKLTLERGTLRANVAKQPATAPLIITTAHAEATVVGTELTVQTTELATRLSVTAGRVKLRKSNDCNSIVVGGGQFAVAAKETSLAARRLPIPLQVIEDFESKTLQWRSFAGKPQRSKIALSLSAGKIGHAALEIDFDAINDGAGACINLEPQDWAGYDGVKFWVKGQKSMADLSIEIFDNAPLLFPLVDNWERFIYEFRDDFVGWRQVTVPFRLFKRRDYQRDGAPDDGLTLTEIHGLSFMGCHGQGVFAVDQVELYRK
jgi:hypothetical protein